MSETGKPPLASIHHPKNRAHLVAWHEVTCPSVNLELELEKFVLFAQAHGQSFVNPVAAAKLWLLKARPENSDSERVPPRPKPWRDDEFSNVDLVMSRRLLRRIREGLRDRHKEKIENGS